MISNRVIFLSLFTLASPVLLLGCGGDRSNSNPNAAAGTLVIRANGEDFVRQGFTSKDGWAISFDHVYVSLADLVAAQTEPPFQAETEDRWQATAEVTVAGPTVVDLAAGDASAEPLVVAEVEAPAGQFNALAWAMPPAPSGPSQGTVIWLQGTATNQGTTLPFTLRLSEPLAFTCGDFIGDERKGMLAPGGVADLEATFHFDHLFGDGGAPPEDEINTGALGFAPLAALAQDGVLNLTSADLQSRLSPADHQRWLGLLPSLGHVGEGHCREVELTR